MKGLPLASKKREGEFTLILRQAQEVERNFTLTLILSHQGRGIYTRL
jgi:hypothetical protein